MKKLIFLIILLLITLNSCSQKLNEYEKKVKTILEETFPQHPPFTFLNTEIKNNYAMVTIETQKIKSIIAFNIKTGKIDYVLSPYNNLNLTLNEIKPRIEKDATAFFIEWTAEN